MSPVKIACRHLWKIFGPEPARVRAAIEQGWSKDDVLNRTGHVLAVRDVSFEVRQGETFVVMGLSGSGKSTLVRCLTRLIEPTSGEVLIDGQDLLAMDEKQLREVRRRRMSMVFQNFGLFPHRKVIDNVAYGLEVQHVDKATRYRRAREVLELVGLAGWENRYPDELSGGMKQRVGLARALAVDPEILFFDEPFSALDPLIRRDMQDELIRLQEVMHKTIVFITHDFLEAIKLGDHIAIMKDGEIVQQGTAQDVVLHPANAYVAEFTEDVPRSHVVTAAAIMTPPEAADTPERYPAAPPHATLQELVTLAAERDARIAIRDGNGVLLGIVVRSRLMRALAGLEVNHTAGR
ncbi:MAG: glycine betaine/L-proline ABC transporter ATP-binding protein [Anaerolineae bacterium]|nr:glycine betaine/L-proline ABC transporter ATP-binding protein [Caldilineales bacterium]MDW8269338.1 glycine betaine/L-proline ABC transporter ATP-binding protein [Anaerolineae bacterium]